MPQEIRIHSSQKVFPDWGKMWYSYKDVRTGVQKARYEKNKEKILSAQKKYRDENRDAVLERKKIWNSGLTKEYRREKYEKYKERIGIEKLRERSRMQNLKNKISGCTRRWRDRKQKEIGYRIKNNLRRGISSICSRQGMKKSTRTQEAVGCDIDFLRKHLESKFKKRMSWDNYGSYWHVDHIIPCASFDHNIESHVKACWNWTNLQPLTARANLAKSDKITNPQFSLQI